MHGHQDLNTTLASYCLLLSVEKPNSDKSDILDLVPNFTFSFGDGNEAKISLVLKQGYFYFTF